MSDLALAERLRILKGTFGARIELEVFSAPRFNNNRSADSDYYRVYAASETMANAGVRCVRARDDALKIAEEAIEALRAHEETGTETDTDEEEPMTNKLISTLSADAEEALYLGASETLAKGVKSALVKMLSKHGLTKSQVSTLSLVLETPIGDAVVSAVIGVLLTFAPTLSADPRVQRLAKASRVTAIKTAGVFVTDAIVAEIGPVVSSVVAGLP